MIKNCIYEMLVFHYREEIQQSNNRTELLQQKYNQFKKIMLT